MTDFTSRLPEPKTAHGALLRRLAEAAMSAAHHDCGEHEPEYQHEVQSMERKFRKILRAHKMDL